MTQDELRKEFIRLSLNRNFDACIELLDMYANYFLLIISNHQLDEVKNKAENEAKIVNQMMLTKVLHIKVVLSGISFTSQNGVSLNNIIDPTIVATLIRNVYETVGMFNLIYLNTKSEDEKLILYNLWASSGLRYRQNFDEKVNTADNISKLEAEKQQIETYWNEIESTPLYSSLDERNQKKLKDKIKEKDYKVQFLGSQVQFLSWQDLTKVMGDSNGLLDKMYTYFSLYAHPSNVAVFQFGDLFSENESHFIDMTIFNLRNLYILLSIFISDYIKLFPDVINSFNQLKLIDQVVINAQLRLARANENPINDSYKMLG